MLYGVSFGESGAHEILSGSVNTYFRGHAPNNGNLIGNACDLWQILGYLKVGFGPDRLSGTLGFPILRIEGIDVTHPPPDLQENDPLGLAEAILARNRWNGGEIG
jgi:hypothetical protein